MGKFDGGMRSGSSMKDKDTINFLFSNGQYADCAIMMKSLAKMNNLDLPSLPLEVFEDIQYPSHVYAIRRWVFENLPQMSALWGDKINEFGKGSKRLKIDLGGKPENKKPRVFPKPTKGSFEID